LDLRGDAPAARIINRRVYGVGNLAIALGHFVSLLFQQLL
jgi:hypothetical protein